MVGGARARNCGDGAGGEGGEDGSLVCTSPFATAIILMYHIHIILHQISRLTFIHSLIHQIITEGNWGMGW